MWSVQRSTPFSRWAACTTRLTQEKITRACTMHYWIQPITVWYCTVLSLYMTCTDIIQFLKVMYLILTLQVPLTWQSVFSKTDSVFLKEDTQKCVFNNTRPRACISQYNPMGVYLLVQALGQVLCNTHSWASAQRMYRTLGIGSFSHSQTSPGKSFCQDAFG